LTSFKISTDKITSSFLINLLLLLSLKRKKAKKLLTATAPLNALLNGAVAYKVLGAAHPLRVLLTSFSKEVIVGCAVRTNCPNPNVSSRFIAYREKIGKREERRGKSYFLRLSEVLTPTISATSALSAVKILKRI